MATSPGQRFVRRQNAARGSTANGTAADITYDTAVLSEGGYSYLSPEVTVDEAGLYLTIFDIGQVDLNSTRAVGTLVPAINTTQQTRFRATHRYLRNSGGAQEGASIGMAILDLAASDDVKVRNPGALSPTDAVGNYATNASYGGALQLIRLPDGNFTHVERTSDAADCGVSNINTTRPWLDSSGTWTTITYNSEVNDDGALYPGTGGDLTLAASKKYLVVWGVTPYSTDGSRHAYVTRLQINGNNVQSGSSYQRNTASQGCPIVGMYLHETGVSSETLRLQATQESEGGDAGTPQIADAYLQVLELPDSAEWIHVDNGATDSLTTALAGLTTWYDTPLSSTVRADGDSNLSLDGTNNAVQNDSGGALPVLAIGWHRWDRDSGASGTRKNPWTRWDNGGAAVGYGVAGAFSRGQQSGDDTFQAHYCSAATMDLANGADLSFQVNDEASSSNADIGIYASTSRYFLGVQVLNLDTLDSGGSGTSPITGDTTLTFSESADLSATGELGGDTSATFTGAADLSATGELEGASSVTFTTDADISSISAIEAAASISFADSVTLSATGALAGDSSVSFSVSADISVPQRESIAVASYLNQLNPYARWVRVLTPRMVPAAAASEIEGTVTVTFDSDASLVGAGGLEAGVTVTLAASADLLGAGVLEGAAPVVFAGDSALTGTGGLEGSESVVFNAVSDISGAGEAAGSAGLTVGVNADVSGAGALEGVAPVAFGDSATLSGAGALAASASVAFDSDAAITGLSPGINGATTVSLSASAAIAAKGELAGDAALAITSDADLSGVSPSLEASAAVSFSAQGDLAATGVLEASADIVFAASLQPTVAPGAPGGYSRQRPMPLYTRYSQAAEEDRIISEVLVRIFQR